MTETITPRTPNTSGAAPARPGPIVRTTRGAVRGAWESGLAVFRGIPYARPPVGPNRFRPPVPPARWDGLRDATRFGDVVPQTDESPIDRMLLPPGVPQGDDCLSLNVWTPDPGAAGLPVLVWIHGGSFKYGAGSCPLYDGATFARDGIVAVTLNYRLGLLGFLHVGDRPGSGNFGLLDQLAALAWVQENIAAFGGDPGRVTLAGESAGADSVGQLLAVPAARGHFRRAVLQSGAASFHISAAAAAVFGAAVLAELGVREGDGAALEGLTSSRLLAAQRAVGPRLLDLLAAQGVAPSLIARYCLLASLPVYGTDVLPEPALDAIAKGAASGVDLLVGTNTDEWTEVITSRAAARAWHPATLAAADAAFAPVGRTGAAVLERYAAGRPGSDVLDVLMPFGTDLVFRIPAIRLAEAAQRRHPHTYLFRFGWGSPPTAASLGATHGIELPFVWDALDGSAALFEAFGATAPPQALADAVHGAWAAFVKTGSPQHPGLPAWPAYEPVRRATMQLDATPRVVDDPDGAERWLWDGVVY